MSGGEAGSSIGSSRKHGDGKHEGSPLKNVLGPGFITEGVSSDGISYGEGS